MVLNDNLIRYIWAILDFVTYHIVVHLAEPDKEIFKINILIDEQRFKYVPSQYYIHYLYAYI